MLDDDGLAAPGEIIRRNDILINKQVPIVTRGQFKSALNDRLATLFAPCIQTRILIVSFPSFPYTHFHMQRV